MPALQTFCLQAAIAIFFNFLFQVFTFVVALIYDEERRRKARVDVLCCIQTNQIPTPPKYIWRKIFGGKYNKLLQNKFCTAFVLIFSVLLLALAIVGLFFVPLGLNEQVSMEV
jgi:Niemann-Pick C1 protein